MTREIRLQATYRHPPARVWQALTDRRALSAWLLDTDFEPEVGRAFTSRTKPSPGFDGIVHGEVLTADPPRTLSHTWRGGGMNTIVTYSLEPITEGTRLRLTHSGLEGLRGLAVGWVLGRGWRRLSRTTLPRVLDQLAERGPAQLDPAALRQDKSACTRAGARLAALVTAGRRR